MWTEIYRKHICTEPFVQANFVQVPEHSISTAAGLAAEYQHALTQAKSARAGQPAVMEGAGVLWHC